MQAVAETTVDLWDLVLEAYKKKHGSYLVQEISQILMDTATRIYITKLINQSRHKGQEEEKERTPGRPKVRAAARRPRADDVVVQCLECGRDLTAKEKRYCDENNLEYVCYHCSH